MPATSAMSTLIWAHRGDSANAPENTLPAFARAMDLGADGVELDVQRTLDGIVVISHDETISRCSNGKGDIAEMPLSLLRKYRFSCGKIGFGDADIPTLEETLTLLSPCNIQVNIELKRTSSPDPGLVPEALNIVRACGMMSRVVFSSFDYGMIAQTRSLAPDARLGMLFGIRQRAPWDMAKAIGAEALHAPLARARLTDFTRHCHDAGMQIRLWTVDAPAAIERAINHGVDGIITNRPGLAMKLRSALAQSI